MSEHNAYMKDKLCACCGKTFVMYDKWAYKKKIKTRYKYFCSWHCLCDYQKQLETKRVQNKHRQGLDKIYARSLTKIRMYYGLRQVDVAAHVGINSTTLSGYETGTPISDRAVNCLAKAFGCTVNDIISDEFDPRKASSWNCAVKKVQKSPQKN